MTTRWKALFGTLLVAPVAWACGMEFINVQYQDVVVLDGKILVNNSRGDEQSAGLRSFAVSPDGQRIALFNKAAQRLRLNDATGTTSMMTFEKRVPLLFAWSQDGARFAMVERPAVGKVRVTVVEVAKKTSREVQLALADNPSGLAFAPDLKSVLVLAKDQLFAVGEKDAQLLLTRPGLHGLTPGPRLVALADGKSLLTLDPGDPASLKPIFAFGKPGPVTALAWSADGQGLFVAQEKLFLVPLTGPGRALEGPAKAHTIARSPDGKFVAAASDSSLMVFDGGGNPVFDTEGGAALRWTRDSHALLISSGDSIVELLPGLWNEKVIVQGVPFETKFETQSMALLEPDYLGQALVYSLFRTAGTTRSTE